MSRKKEDDYKVVFRGATISKHEANRVGVGIICGLLGMVVAFLITGGNNKIIDYSIIAGSGTFGYIWLGKRIFKK